jgi:hypothetical protein
MNDAPVHHGGGGILLQPCLEINQCLGVIEVVGLQQPLVEQCLGLAGAGVDPERSLPAAAAAAAGLEALPLPGIIRLCCKMCWSRVLILFRRHPLTQTSVRGGGGADRAAMSMWPSEVSRVHPSGIVYVVMVSLQATIRRSLQDIHNEGHSKKDASTEGGWLQATPDEGLAQHPGRVRLTQHAAHACTRIQIMKPSPRGQPWCCAWSNLNRVAEYPCGPATAVDNPRYQGGLQQSKECSRQQLSTVTSNSGQTRSNLS